MSYYLGRNKVSITSDLSSETMQASKSKIILMRERERERTHEREREYQSII
jgi:BRCT domain type II-containing protein